ncbi:CRISPR-associated endonuclease Cas2 [Litorivicinus sp.]|nr:CRISPR-associated endonuclease Cas2 [Litorivicinus sp.]
MRLLVFFDLPVVGREQKRAYVLFRRFLLKDGYDMMQWSVYARLINGIDRLEKHRKRLKAHLPPEGSIRCLAVSEKQFASIEILVGVVKKQEKVINADQLLLI